jgi:hypothetical protein
VLEGERAEPEPWVREVSPDGTRLVLEGFSWIPRDYPSTGCTAFVPPMKGTSSVSPSTEAYRPTYPMAASPRGVRGRIIRRRALITSSTPMDPGCFA